MKKTWIILAAGAAVAALAALSRKKEAEEEYNALLCEEDPACCENQGAREIVQEPEAEDTYYWAQKGGVWHSVANCGYLTRTSQIQSGTIEQAQRAGKTRACSSCAL